MTNSNNSYGLITGATSGIGKYYALRLAEQGFHLILTGRRKELLEKLAGELKESFGISVELVLGDLQDTSVVNEIVSKCLSVNLVWLVNNAGFGGDRGFFQEQLEDIHRMVDVHTWVPVRLCRELIPGMVARKTGYVVNVSSLASQMALPGSLVYTATKAMLHNFTLSLSIELWGTGVRVQSLLPGFTHTDFHDKLANFPLERKNKGFIRWQSAEAVVFESIKRITGNRWKKTTLLTGWSNHILLWFIRILPFGLYRRISKGVRP